MATFSTSRPVSLARIGLGLQFTGFIVLGASETAQPVRVGGNTRMILLEITDGSLTGQYLYDGRSLAQAFTGAIADRQGYQLGYVLGIPSQLIANVRYLSLDIRTLDRTVDIAGSVEVDTLVSTSVLTTEFVDTTAPDAIISGLQPILDYVNPPAEFDPPTASISATQPNLDFVISTTARVVYNGIPVVYNGNQVVYGSLNFFALEPFTLLVLDIDQTVLRLN